MHAYFTSLFFCLMIGFNFIIQTSINPLFAIEFVQIDESNAKLEHATEPCVIVIFGATGDLTARKLLPAIYNLAHQDHLSKQTAIFGLARSEYTDQSFRTQMNEAIHQFSRNQVKDDFWNQFQNKIFYNQADFEQDEGYKNLYKRLLKIDQEFGTQGNRMYYLATPPSYFSIIIKKLFEHQLLHDSSNSKSWSRVVLEKPFGTDLESAIDLQKNVTQYLDESQLYRMDHYLGKEGVQNLFTLRFESGLFEPLWNKDHIDHVQITLSEEIGIGSRARFWEETGSLRDVLQNHLMQLLAMIAMEPPARLESSYIHKEKIKLLNAIRPFPLTEINRYVIRGQYGPGKIGKSIVPGYKQEQDVLEDSLAETFIAAKMFIDNPRWQGVPFYIRGGKRLPKQTTEIVIAFKNRNSFNEPISSNLLFIRIQPNAGIFLKTVSKVPMLNKTIHPVVFGFQLDSYFGKSSPEAYEKLFYDCINGDRSLYVEGEEQLAAWRLLTPVLNYWKTETAEKPHIYDAGTWGPSAADELLRENGHEWLLLETNAQKN